VSRSADTADQLAPRIRALFSALDHAGEFVAHEADGAAHRAHGEAGREELGTRVQFSLAIAGQRLVGVRYRAYGCPHTLATCEWLARSLEGRRLDSLAIGDPLEWAQRLDVPAAKLGRLLVIEDALRAALTRS